MPKVGDGFDFGRNRGENDARVAIDRKYGRSSRTNTPVDYGGGYFLGVDFLVLQTDDASGTDLVSTYRLAHIDRSYHLDAIQFVGASGESASVVRGVPTNTRPPLAHSIWRPVGGGCDGDLELPENRHPDPSQGLTTN